MTSKEQAAMQQALEALESYSKSDYIKKQHPKRRANGEKAITALREALAEQAKQEPVAYISRGGLEELKAEGRTEIFAERDYECAETLPLYAAPVRTKDLTSAEIWDATNNCSNRLDIARDAIAADREKNK